MQTTERVNSIYQRLMERTEGLHNMTKSINEARNSISSGDMVALYNAKMEANLAFDRLRAAKKIRDVKKQILRSM
ncbi:hypothetical protein [Veronia pacifica]|uniref:Uncharacterized protein n=1 Tax=Veronia pacifica TaxID=1080227 RepID=A0A1C3EQZ3_9GAMM|nr:hypothetical protein [Veronia pacifica]ODA35663.1 hypothetical protein A8L45_03350 [Veronia pacifica]